MDATSLLYPICNFNFVVDIVIVQICLYGFYESPQQITTREITWPRQSLKITNLVQSSLKDCRVNVEQFNRQCFERSVKICEPLDTDVKKPRTCGRQTMRKKFKDTKGVIRIRKSKNDRQHNDQKKKYKRTNNDIHTHKTKDQVMFRQRAGRLL